MPADGAGEIGAEAVIGLNAALPQGIAGKIGVPEILQHYHFFGQGRAVGRGGDEAEFSGWFPRGLLAGLAGGGFLRGRQFQGYGCDFADALKIFLQGAGCQRLRLAGGGRQGAGI